MKKLLLLFGFSLLAASAQAANCSNTTVGAAVCKSQGLTANPSSATSAAGSISSALTTDIAIVASNYCQDISCNTAPTSTATIADSGTSSCAASNANPYTSTGTNDKVRIYVWLCTGLSSGNHTWTVTTNATTFYQITGATLWSGVGTTFDSAAVDKGTQGTSANPSAATSGATTNANDLIYGYINVGTTTPTAGSGFTEVQTTASGSEAEGKTVSATGTQTATWTASAQNWKAVVVAIKLPAATGCSGSRLLLMGAGC